MANLLTGLRLLLIVPVSWALGVPGSVPTWLLLLMLVLAIATDYFDGIVARNLGTASARDMLFDHTTDFLLVTSGLFAIAHLGIVPQLLPALIVVAFSQYVLDSYLLFRQKHLRMSYLGRWNGILYFVPLVAVAMARLESLAPVAPLVLTLTTGFGYVLIVSTLASIADRAIAPLRQHHSVRHQNQQEH